MMDNVLQKLMAVVHGNEDVPEIHWTEIIEKGAHLPGYKDINAAHKVFIDSLDDSHPKAVEMLLAAEKLKEMAEQFRVDKDAMEEALIALTTTLGCAMVLANETTAAEGNPKAMHEAVQKHFVGLLTCLTELERAFSKYGQHAVAMGLYQR